MLERKFQLVKDCASGRFLPADCHVFGVLGRRLERWSTTEIGKFYNGRDHLTVCRAVGRIEVLQKSD